MKCLVIFSVMLCMCCAVVNTAIIKKDYGERGIEFWGTNHTVMEGDNVTLVCNSKAKAGYEDKVSTYIWQLHKRPFYRVYGFNQEDINLVFLNNYIYYTINREYQGLNPRAIPGSRDITLNNVGRYATALYYCLVRTIWQRNPQKTYEEATWLHVTVLCPPKIEKNKTYIEISADDKQNNKLTLNCISSGSPTPVFTWSRLDGRPLPTRTLTHSKGLLAIHNVGQLEGGKYKCVSSNTYGNDTRIFTVNVTVQARITTTEKSYATIGKDGVVKCVAVGVPKPTFSWKWYEGQYEQTLSSVEGQVGRFRVKNEHFFGNSTSYLMIKGVRRVDLRDYECSVKNGAIDSRKIPLIGYTIPDRPVIQTVSSSTTSITLTWKVGENDGGRPITAIIIEYIAENGTQWKSERVENARTVRQTINRLEPDTEYTLRVFAVNEMGSSQPSANHFEKTDINDIVDRISNNKGQSKEEGVNMMVMVVGVAGGFLVLIIAIVIVCILMRNMQQNSAKKAAENAERMAKSANQDNTTALINFLQHGGDRLSTTTGSGDVLQLTTSNKWEFPRDRLQLQNVLGSGAFGIVMRADAEGISGINSGTTPVAVKFVKENESASAKKDLIAELELLKLIEPHKNVINLLGCCTRSEPLMVIVEFCAYGDLQSFLRSSRGIRDQYYLECYKRPSTRLTSNELLMFGTQISRGMAHLACLKVIHRDLAARNILVDENQVCKVSDFGFARDIYVEDHYTRKTAGGRFPIKWMAIESLLDGISTTKSDVWSFAIVLWEIITLGASPYPGMNSQEVVSFLQNGMRMDKPKHCSDELYNLLLDCWQVASHRRPNFEMLARYLERMCNDDFEYINMRTYDDHLYINFDGNTVSEGSNSATLMKDTTTNGDEESAGEKADSN